MKTARLNPSGAGAGHDPAEAELLTPHLRFLGVEEGCSTAQPVAVQPADGPLDLEPLDLVVVVPPLAPFSVIDPPSAGPGRPRDRLWVRYDATSPMAVDRGALTVGVAGSGRRWVVSLTGSGHLARPNG